MCTSQDGPPETLLAQAKSGTDGMFYLSYFTTGPSVPDYAYYDMVLSHPGITVADVEPGEGGVVRSPTWVRFTLPITKPFGTNWYLAEVPPKLAVAPSEPVPAFVKNPVFQTIEPIDFKVDGVELTQAIQCFDTSEGDPNCPDNSLPRVAGKLTAARVYISRAGSTPANPQYPSRRVDLFVSSATGVGPAVDRDIACVGDCGLDGAVTIDEIIIGVNIALGTAEIRDCPAFDPSGDQMVTVNEIIQGVSAALNGCGEQ